MKKLLIIILIFSSTSVIAQGVATLRFTGGAEKGNELTQGDFEVGFDQNGMTLTSKKKISWKSSEDVGLFPTEEIKENGDATSVLYRWDVPGGFVTLSKNTRVHIREDKLIVEIDKEVLPIGNLKKKDREPGKNKKSTAKSEASSDVSFLSAPGLNTGSISMRIGIFLLVFAGLVFVFIKFIKKPSSARGWLSVFTKNAQYRKGPVIEMISTHSMGAKKQLNVIRAGGEYLLIGLSGDQMTLLTKIDEQTVEEEDALIETEIETKKRSRNIEYSA